MASSSESGAKFIVFTLTLIRTRPIQIDKSREFLRAQSSSLGPTSAHCMVVHSLLEFELSNVSQAMHSRCHNGPSRRHQNLIVAQGDPAKRHATSRKVPT